MKFNSLTSFVCLSFLAPAVLGHGYVEEMVIGGKTYKGPSPYSSAKVSSPIRKVSSTNPITDVTSADMTCGIRAATTAAVVAPAAAGSKLTYTWRQGSGAHWGHSIGPMLTYMAQCPSTGCSGWNPQKADFFKISETGRKPNSMEWYMADIKAGKTYSTTIPKNIPNGDYIVRHEMIALHFATAPDAAQLFPSCSQIRVTGGSDAVSLRAATNVSAGRFPGAYKATDAGIYVPKIYTSKSYTFPGPAVATFSPSKASRSLNSTLPLTPPHPHHHNVTLPSNTTGTTNMTLRVRPSPPIRLGSTILVPSASTSTHSVHPTERVAHGGKLVKAKETATTSTRMHRVVQWNPIKQGSTIHPVVNAQPEPTQTSATQIEGDHPRVPISHKRRHIHRLPESGE